MQKYMFPYYKPDVYFFFLLTKSIANVATMSKPTAMLHDTMTSKCRFFGGGLSVCNYLRKMQL